MRKAVRRALEGGALSIAQGRLARSPEAVLGALSDLVHDPDTPPARLRDTVRRSALRDLLLDWLVSPEAAVRAGSAELCGALQVQDAVPWLERLAADPDAAVRRSAIRALGDMHAWPAADALVRRLRGASGDRGRVVATLAAASPDHYLDEALRRALPAHTEGALLLALGLRGGTAARPTLLDRLDSGSAATRAVAARAAGYAGGPGLVPALLVSSLDRSPRVREEAARSVRRLRARSRGGIGHGPAQTR